MRLRFVMLSLVALGRRITGDPPLAGFVASPRVADWRWSQEWAIIARTALMARVPAVLRLLHEHLSSKLAARQRSLS